MQAEKAVNAANGVEEARLDFLDIFSWQIFGSLLTHMLQTWNIYLHEWLTFIVNLGKYSEHWSIW